MTLLSSFPEDESTGGTPTARSIVRCENMLTRRRETLCERRELASERHLYDWSRRGARERSGFVRRTQCLASVSHLCYSVGASVMPWRHAFDSDHLARQ